MMSLFDIATNYTVRIILLGTTLLGITTGVLGCFAFLRQQSLLGDAISHAALPGIAIMFLCTHSTSPAILLFGGAIAGLIGTFFIHLITSKTPLKNDAALGIVLSVFFGIGLVLITIIQKKPIGQQAILNKFLFGNASTLLESDLYTMFIISAIVLLATFLLSKELILCSFDPIFAQATGFPLQLLDFILTICFVFSIVIGLQTVGVVLMSTMFIAPAAAARQWTNSFKNMVFLAAFFGAVSSTVGTFLSSCYTQLPTGPTIVVCMSSIVIFSLMCAPNRGVLSRVLANYVRKG